MVRAQGSGWATDGISHRACRAALTHTAAPSYVCLLKFTKMNF